MDPEPTSDPERLLPGHPLAYEAYLVAYEILEAMGPFSVRTTKSQLAFRRRRGLAYLWLPVAWARRPGVEFVLSIALARHDDSTRWKQVAHPADHIWIHHLQVCTMDDLDEEVHGWLREAKGLTSSPMVDSQALIAQRTAPSGRLPLLATISKPDRPASEG